MACGCAKFYSNTTKLTKLPCSKQHNFVSFAVTKGQRSWWIYLSVMLPCSKQHNFVSFAVTKGQHSWWIYLSVDLSVCLLSINFLLRPKLFSLWNLVWMVGGQSATKLTSDFECLHKLCYKGWNFITICGKISVYHSWQLHHVRKIREIICRKCAAAGRCHCQMQFL